MYGDHAFTIKPTIFQSDIEAAKKANLVDFDDLEKRARDYAKVRLGCATRFARVVPRCRHMATPGCVMRADA